MTDYEFPAPPELEKAYRAAYTALYALVRPRSVISEEGASFLEILAEFPFLLDKADLVTIGQLGPPLSWQAPRHDGDFDLIMAGIDLDHGAHDFGPVEFSDTVSEGPNGGWRGSALDRAGLVYKRSCGWDFAPGEAGVWLMMLAPVMAGGGGEDGPWFFDGRLAGFVVVYDRDEDGAYESVGHIWTAASWQRRGIARRLLTEARSRFPITNVEEPYTDAGAAFLNAMPEN